MTKYTRDFSLSFTAPSLRARTSALGLSGCPLHVPDRFAIQPGDGLELVDALAEKFDLVIGCGEGVSG